MNNLVWKIIAWRIISFSLTTLVTYVYVGNLLKSVDLAIILQVVLAATQFVLETLWENCNSNVIESCRADCYN